MKKTFIAIAFAMVSGMALFAEQNIAIGMGFVSNSVTFDMPGAETKYKYSNIGYTLDYFAGSSVGFLSGLTFSLPKVVNVNDGSSSLDVNQVSGAFSLDSLFGLGFCIGRESPLSALVGGGLSFTICNLSTAPYHSSNIAWGVGASGSLRYRFSPNFGISAIFRDEYYLFNIDSNTSARNLGDYYKSANSMSVSGALSLTF